MCGFDPATMFAISTVMSGVQGVMGFVGQSQQAAAQEAQNKQMAENIRAATVANYDQLNLQREQERAAASQQIEETQRDALIARSTARTSAGEAGVAGLSVDALLRDFYGREQRYVGSVNQNFENLSKQIDQQGIAVQKGAQSQLASMPLVEKPSFLDAAVAFGGSTLGHYNNYLKVNTGKSTGKTPSKSAKTYPKISH